MDNKIEAQTKPFASVLDWEQWLAENVDRQEGVWLQIAKKASGIPTVTYDEALDSALCYGWIDGQRKIHSDAYFVQKFTPRRPKSLWSKRNVAKVTELIASGKMQPAGLREVEAAQTDGRWEAAYDAQKDMVVPDDFLQAIKSNESAQTYFNTLSKSDKFAVAWRLQTARTPETRKKRFEALLALLEQNAPLHKTSPVRSDEGGAGVI